MAKWSAEQIAALSRGVQKYNGKNWNRIAAEFVPGHTPLQCRTRWHLTDKPGINKGAWSEEEDATLRVAMAKYGLKNWRLISASIPGRNMKQCRDRWFCYLSPSVNRTKLTEEEIMLIEESIVRLGKKWTKIANLLPGRSENTIKNYWNAKVRREIRAVSSTRRRISVPRVTKPKVDVVDDAPSTVVVDNFGSAARNACKYAIEAAGAYAKALVSVDKTVDVIQKMDEIFPRRPQTKYDFSQLRRIPLILRRKK